MLMRKVIASVIIFSLNNQAALPKEAKFERVHVGFMGGDMAIPMAKSYATMVSLGVEDTMIPAMFAQIHQKRQAPKDEAELKQPPS